MTNIHFLIVIRVFEYTDKFIGMIRTYVSVNLELKYEYVILLMQCSIKVFYILAIHVTHWGLWKKKSLNTDLADK